MKKIVHLPFVIAIFTSILCSCSFQYEVKPTLYGNYLGMDEPGSEPVLFAPNVVATQHHEHSSAIFSPDGKDLFWTQMFTPLQSPLPGVILHMHQNDKGKWTKPEVAAFSGQYNDQVNFFSLNGKTLYFSSDRPTNPEVVESGPSNIWKVSKIDGSWGEPEQLLGLIDADPFITDFQITNSGHVYYLTSMEGVRGNMGLYMQENMSSPNPVSVPLNSNINSEKIDWCLYVDPDERFLIFSSNRDGGFGGLDLYISYKDETNDWGEAVNLGPEINGTDNERFPYISPCGGYLFFTSKRTDLPEYHSERQTLKDFEKNSKIVKNGLSNIYWVKADFLSELNSN